MNYSNTISAILRGRWLLDKQWAEAHKPFVFSILNGEQIDFSTSFKNVTNPDSAGKNIPGKVADMSKVFSVAPGTNLNYFPNNSMAMVTMAGPLLKRGDRCSYGMMDYAELITALGSTSTIKGIILNIDSPGGQVDGTQMLSGTIKQVAKNKPVFAVIDDGLAASAAMWIASAANEIYVTQNTDRVGSIGVYVTIGDWNAHYQEYYKLKFKDVYAPQSTDKNRDYREAIKGNDELIRRAFSNRGSVH